MDNSFNFLNQPVLSALMDAASMLPGLKQVDLLYTEQVGHQVQLKRVKANNVNNLEDISLPIASLADIHSFKDQIFGTRWYDPIELPFSDMKRIERTNDIFDEILKSVLCIGLPSLINKGNDVFVFYFRKDASEFGPMREDKMLETTQKIVIERLLQSSLKAILKNYHENRKAMVDFNNNIQGLLVGRQQKMNDLEEKLKRMRQEMDSVILGILDELNVDGDIIKLSDQAKSLLRPHLSDISLLRDALKKALAFAKTISFGLVSEEINLHEDYFRDLIKKPITKGEQPYKKADEYSVNTKMYRFLDSLEKAAHKLSIQGVKLTSSNVGSILEQPITAAAISDKLKNHYKKINLLLQQYPDHWMIIRNRFRPVVNIQEKASGFKVA